MLSIIIDGAALVLNFVHLFVGNVVIASSSSQLIDLQKSSAAILEGQIFQLHRG